MRYLNALVYTVVTVHGFTGYISGLKYSHCEEIAGQFKYMSAGLWYILKVSCGCGHLLIESPPQKLDVSLHSKVLPPSLYESLLTVKFCIISNH